jgi:hypothetical protein
MAQVAVSIALTGVGERTEHSGERAPRNAFLRHMLRTMRFDEQLLDAASA